MTAAIDFLTKAAALMAERGKQYDQPAGERSMGKAVAAFNVITGQALSEAEGWLLLQVLKDVRQWQRPEYHADSAEDCVAYAALKAEALKHADVVAAALGQLDPVVVANAAAFNADWPNELRRQDAQAEDEAEAEAWEAIEARMDVIGRNGNGGEHYLIGCAICHGKGAVDGKPCPACQALSSRVCRP